jgi:hypothetical protein
MNAYNMFGLLYRLEVLFISYAYRMKLMIQNSWHQEVKWIARYISLPNGLKVIFERNGHSIKVQCGQ